MKIIFKCNIEELIIKSGLRKKVIADALEVSTHQLRNYETGHTPIPIFKGIILAELISSRFPCTIADFYERIVEEE